MTYDIMEMVRFEETLSNQSANKNSAKPPSEGSVSDIMEMVRLEENALNQIFDEMANWNSVLQDTSLGKGLNEPEP